VATSGIVLSDKCYVLSLTLWIGTSKLFSDGKQGRSWRTSNIERSTSNDEWERMDRMDLMDEVDIKNFQYSTRNIQCPREFGTAPQIFMFL